MSLLHTMNAAEFQEFLALDRKWVSCGLDAVEALRRYELMEKRVPRDYERESAALDEQEASHYHQFNTEQA